MMQGVMVIDKPKGKTSHDVVIRVKKLLGVEKAGHTGTLDPIATGVLPICFNEATKLAAFLAGDDKEYRATMLLGVKTDTMDIEGKIVSQSDRRVAEDEIRRVMENRRGKIEQVPPVYSAVKYGGKPLYKWARNGIFISPKPRAVTIHSLVVEKVDFPHVTFRVVCSKGTYLRALCSEVGDLLGTGACLSALRRLRSGIFSEDIAVTLEALRDMKKEDVERKIMAMTDLLPLSASIELKEGRYAAKLQNGEQPSAEMLREQDLPLLKEGQMVKFTHRGHLIAVAKVLIPFNDISHLHAKHQVAKIIRVFHGA